MAKWTLDHVLGKGLKYNISAPVSTQPEKDKKPSKYKNKKIEIDGIVFDSINEGEFYRLLKANGFVFDMQVKFELLTKEKVFGDTLRGTSIILDFIVYKDQEKQNPVAYVDTKGMITKDAKIKLLLLIKKLRNEQGLNPFFALPKNKKQRIEVISEIKNLLQ